MTDNLSDNELIAEFMGFTPMKSNHGTHEHPALMGTYGGSGLKFKYDTSWDWLMPVVEKIEKLEPLGEYYVDMRTTKCNIYKGETCISGSDGGIKSRMERLYKSVVDFIKWYNTTNPV